MGLVQSFVPLARPMKFSTPIGATFGNSVQCRSSAVVWMMAVGSAVTAGAELAGLRTGGFGFVAGCGVEAACAAPSRDVEIIRTIVCSRVRMDAPVSILARFDCTTIDPGLSVEAGRARPAAMLLQVHRWTGEAPVVPLSISGPAFRGSLARLRGRRGSGCRPESCGYRRRCSPGRAGLA